MLLSPRWLWIEIAAQVGDVTRVGQVRGGIGYAIGTGLATLHCMKVGLGKSVVFTDVGSGLNATRPGLARLCKQVESGCVRTGVVSFKDRLTRFEFEYLRRYFASHGASIIVARQPATLYMQDELVEDLIAIVTSFSGRVHGRRGTHGKRMAGSEVNANPRLKVIDKAVSTAVDVAVVRWFARY